MDPNSSLRNPASADKSTGQPVTLTVKDLDASTGSILQRSVTLTEGFIIEEIMTRLRAVIAEKPRDPWYQRLISHQLTLLVLGFVLSVLLGGWLAHYYSVKQHEVVAARGFSDELNKLQIQKIGDVWEKLYYNELLIDRLLAESREDTPPGGKTPDARLEQIEKLVAEDGETIARFRFWLTDATYRKIWEHLNATVEYSRVMLLEPTADTNALLEKRQLAKSNVDQERARFLKRSTELIQGAGCYLF